MSDLFKNICKLLKITKLYSTAYHPQSQVSLERTHRTLGEYLRTYSKADPANWDHWIPFAIFAFNSTPHTQTKIMPFELVYGFKPRMPNTVQKYPDLAYNFNDYCTELKYKLQSSWSLSRNNLINQKHASKEKYDSNVHFDNIEEGDEVLLEDETSSSKTKPLRNGPFIVLKMLSDENSVIKIEKKSITVHNNILRLFKK